jgi:autophagy-related protein 13
MESVLSERFVDMDEDWFTPTVARHRLEAEARAAGTPPSSSSPSRPSPVQASPSPARYPIPGSSLRYEAGSYRASTGATPKEPSSLGAAKWGALGENLPFASGAQGAHNDTPPSPSAATAGATTTGPIPYRRLSAHSFQPFHSYSASPSASILRNLTGASAGTAGTPAAPGTPGTPNTPASGRAIPGLPSSTGRQSSFLSQSGRSYSHAQIAHLQGGASASPPVGPIGGSPPPFAPSSLSFAKQALPRQSSYGMHSTSSPFVPSSVERDSPLTAPALPKRYSSSLSHHRRSIGSSPQETHGLPSSVALARRPSTRESGLRHSLDEAPPDSDEVHAFLRALDSWTPPPSLAPRASSSSIPQSGNPAVTTTAATPGSGGRSPAMGSGSGSGVSGARVPLTRTHVDDMLKRMAGSFGPTATPASPSAGPSRPPSSQPTPSSRRDSNGSAEDHAYQAAGVRPLPIGGGGLSAQPPATGSPRVASLRSEAAGSPGNVPRGSVPRASGSLPRAPALASTPEEPPCLGAARSLPAGPHKTPSLPKIGGTTPGSPFPSRQAPSSAACLLSPQTTGGTTRRGPVLVRGGFGAPSASSKASTSSSSPSHSPVREYRYRSGLTAERERSERERDGGLAGIGLPSGYGVGGLSGLPPGPFSSFSNTGSRGASSTRRTAPSSLGADHDMPRVRGRVASEGSASPIRERSGSRARSTSPHSPVVEGLMARLALAHGREMSSSPTEE